MMLIVVEMFMRSEITRACGTRWNYLVECRKEEWNKRIADVVASLDKAKANKINSTQWIGH
jgi:hypothetical protein